MHDKETGNTIHHLIFKRQTTENRLKNRLSKAPWLASTGFIGFVSLGLLIAGSRLAQAEPPIPAQTVQAASSVRQGEVLKVILTSLPDSEATPQRIKLAGRSASFYRQDDGSYLALLAVSVFQKPGSYPLSLEDSRNHIQTLRDIQVQDGRYKTQNVNVTASTEGLKPLPGEMEAIQALKEEESPTRYWSEPFISPTSDCQNSPFGVKRFHNGKPTGDYHKGVDLRSPQGRPIHATTDGVVRIAKMYRLHGGTVGIDHGQGVSSIYIHMSRLNVHPADRVRKGDVIGFVGSTGFATGPHLHWGLYVNGLPVNPNPWLPQVPVCR